MSDTAKIKSTHTQRAAVIYIRQSRPPRPRPPPRSSYLPPPAFFTVRLVLGLKGTMSEAELHILRERLNGGIRHKAARGALRRGLPVGLIWGEKGGEVRCRPAAAG